MTHRKQNDQEQLLCTFGNCKELQGEEEEFCNAHGSMLTDTAEQITDADTEEIARLVKEGYTSGLLSKDNGKKLDWKLQIDIF